MVDDEHLVLEVGQAMLEALGYTVITATNGTNALETLKQRQGEIHLILLDLVMPGLDGKNTFDQIQNTYPNLPVILSSGYSMNGQAMEIMDRGCNGFIQKPFTINELSQVLRKGLDVSAPTAKNQLEKK